MPERANGKLNNCGCCHTCGSFLEKPGTDKEYCHSCGAYRRYRSHGFSLSSCDSSSKLQALCPVHTERGQKWAHYDICPDSN